MFAFCKVPIKSLGMNHEYLPRLLDCGTLNTLIKRGNANAPVA